MSEKNTVARERSPHLSVLIPELWAQLTEAQRELLLIWSSFYIYKKGEVIFEAEQISQHCYILASGQVKITREGYGDRSQILRMVRPVEFFGMHSYFAQTPHVCSAVALDRSVVCIIPIHIIEDIIRSNALVGYEMLCYLSSRISEADRLTISLTQKHTRGRLAEALLMLRERYGVEEDGCTLGIYLSRQELANLSNMTTSNAIRTLHAFVEERVIALDGRKIKLLNEEKLIEIVKLG